jgi:hypothetical protein
MISEFHLMDNTKFKADKTQLREQLNQTIIMSRDLVD